MDEFIRVLGEYGITATPRTRRGSVFIKFISSSLPHNSRISLFLLPEKSTVLFFGLTILSLHTILFQYLKVFYF